MNPKYSAPPVSAPVYHYLGPSRAEQAASPYVDVRVGIPETPGGNNHMRRQVALSPSGTVHMVYSVFDADSDGVVKTTADSNTNGFYFYNAYDCGGSNTLRNGSKDVPMEQVFTAIGDTRPRKIQRGGIFILPGTDKPVVYGNRYILRTDLGMAGRYDGSPRGLTTMKDSAECLGLFTMDTSYTNMDRLTHPVIRAVNESTFVATTYRIGFPNQNRFTHTTDRGMTWSPVQNLNFYSVWFNSTDIAGNGNTFYIVSHTDPNNPTAFLSTERPCYLKGICNPATGGISFETIQDITGDFELPNFLANFVGISALMIGDTLHVIWTDWNNYNYKGFGGPGGHVHHAAVLPDGTVQGPHKIANVNIDGRLPGRSTTLFGYTNGVWPNVSLSYNPATGNLYALWSQPPDNGNFGWADYEATHTLACYDIFCSASPNNGRSWDDPQNVTQTNNPGCDGSFGNPCSHEDWFSSAEIVNDTVWVVAMVQRHPGINESYFVDLYPDIGPSTNFRDIFRLYKIPARAPVLSVRADLTPLAVDSIRLDSIWLLPRGGITNVPMLVSNLGLVGFLLDSIKITGNLNDGALVTTIDAVPGTPILPGGAHNFNLSFNPSGVSTFNQGTRSGSLEAYVHTDDPSVPSEEREKIVEVLINVHIILRNFCSNRKLQIHSGTNYTDIGTQGSIKDASGFGMFYPAVNGGSDRFYDGGVWIANSALNAAPCVQDVPRKVTRQLFADKFLRCLTDGILDSIPGNGDAYYNLFLKSIATDVEDTTLVWQNIWEQSTHPDSSDFLIQTTRVINIGSEPIDSVAMGVAYDIDVASNISNPQQNVSGDTSVSYLGRKFWIGWTAGNDVAIDTCSPNSEMYGVVIIPGSIGNSGDSIHPRGAVMYDQAGFSYNTDNCIYGGGDSLCQRYMWNLNVCTSTRRRTHDTLTGVWQDTLQPPPYFVCDGDSATDAPYRNDEGYLAVAKKVYNFPVNGGGQFNVGRYGLGGLAASVDTFFSGQGETYTVIHVASNGGLSQLLTNALKGIDWYINHANLQVGTNQTWLKADLNRDGQLTPADAVLALNYVFLALDNGAAIPICAADLNNDQVLTAVDLVLLINKIFLNTGCLNCLRPCI